MMEGRSLREVSIDMTWNRTYVRTAIEEGNYADWETIKAFLSYLGFDVKFVHVAMTPAILTQSKTKVIYFPARWKQGLNAGREAVAPSPRLLPVTS